MRNEPTFVGRLFAVAVVFAAAAGCSSEPAKTETPQAETPKAAPRHVAEKRSDALDIGLSQTRGADADRLDAERTFRAAVDDSTELLLLTDGSAKSRRHVELVLDVGAFHPTSDGIAREVVLLGTIHDGTCQVFRLATKVSRRGPQTADAEDRELLFAGIKDVFQKLEGLAPKIGEDATCLDTGDRGN
ncbi:MAG: hypothetical protein U0271_34795 [Polyangiaceae bacterium]